MLFTFPAREENDGCGQSCNRQAFQAGGQEPEDGGIGIVFSSVFQLQMSVLVEYKGCDTGSITITGISSLRNPAKRIPVRAVWRLAPSALCVIY